MCQGNILDVLQKDILVNEEENWSPDLSMMMHVATIADYGAHSSTIEDNKKEILEIGGKPKKLRMIITVEIETL